MLANNLFVRFRKLSYYSQYLQISYLQIHHFGCMNFANHHFLTKTMTQCNFYKFIRIGTWSALTQISPNALRRVM